MNTRSRFFLADDDEDDIYLFREVLKDVDPAISLYVANDSKEALDRLTEQGTPLPDIIFMDLNMPRMSGKECLAALKKDSRLRDIPVIIYSTSIQQKDIAEARSNGATGFFIKPTSIGELQQILSFISNSSLRDMNATIKQLSAQTELLTYLGA